MSIRRRSAVVLRASLAALAAAGAAAGCTGSGSSNQPAASTSGGWIAPRATATPGTSPTTSGTSPGSSPSPSPSPSPATSPTPIPVQPPTSGISWTARSFPVFADAQAFDVASLPGPADQSYLLLSLQGIVNRTRPRIYFQTGPFASLWLQRTQVAAHAVADPMTLLVKYASEVKGIVIYDDALLDTVNLATTIAGVEGGVVASPALAATLTAAPYSFSVIADLRTNHFASALDVYKYELATYVPRTTDRLLVGLDPKIADCLRDYAVATQAAVVWLDPRDATQAAVLDGFLGHMKTNAPYLGWWTQEQAGVGEAARFSVPTFAADYSPNLSAVGGVHGVSGQQPAPPPPPALAAKAYVALIVSDGDNVQECQNLIPSKWADPARGQVPISWTVQPGLVDLAPVVLDYFVSTATPKDVLISGPSGLGYTYPGTWPTATLPAYVQASADVLERSGIRVVTVWNDSLIPFSWSSCANVFAAGLPHLLGATDQVTWAPFAVANGTLPVLALSTRYGKDEASLESGIDGALAGWSRGGPLFVAAQGDNNQTAINPTTLLAVQQHYASNADVVFVRADHLFQLLREANGLPVNP